MSFLPLQHETAAAAANETEAPTAVAVGNTHAPISVATTIATKAATATTPLPKKKYTMKEVGEHNLKTNIWLVIDNEVFDMTEFQDEHPGGAKILSGIAGKDATKKFDKYHRRGILERYRSSLQIGVLDSSSDEGTKVSSGKNRLLGKFGFGGKK